MLLADLGADVVKVEEPSTGDHTRHSWGKPQAGGDSAAFFSLNRNKRSICLDLKTTAGREQLYELAANVDVVVENFKPGITARLGVDYTRTWSCYKGGAVHCGKCGTCVERREAFQLAVFTSRHQKNGH